MTEFDESESEEDDEGGKATVFGHAFDWGHDEDQDQAPDERLEPDVLRFELGGRSFAVEAVHVSEVDSPPALTPIPGLPAHIAGVAVRRRQVLSVLDLAAFFGLGAAEGADRRLLVFESDDLEVGTVVSSVSGLEVWPDDGESPKLDDIDERILPFVAASRWAPGGRVLLLSVPDLLRAAAVR